MDHEVEDAGNVFQIPDLWKPSKCLSLGPDYTSHLFPTLNLDDIDKNLPLILQSIPDHDSFFNAVGLSLPYINDLNHPTSPTIDDNEKENDKIQNDTIETEDIWLLPEEIPLKSANYQSWSAFERVDFSEPVMPYITEAGREVFDAAVASDEDFLRIANSDFVVVDTKAYMASLLSLGLGRASVFFSWEADKGIFSPKIDKIRITGHSGDTSQGLQSTFMRCGMITRFLQDVVDKIYCGNSTPGRIALADAVSTSLVTIQKQLGASASLQKTPLQLQSLFMPAITLLTCFQRIVKSVSSTRNDEAMLSTIYQEVQALEHRTDNLKEILLQILIRVSKPWLEFSAEWLGLHRDSGIPITKLGKGKSFVKVEMREWIDEQGVELDEPDFTLNFDKVPSFMAPEDARSMFEVGRSLRFLRDHHPDHPLSSADVVASADPPCLEWKFSWEDVMKVEDKALRYEKDLLAALQQYRRDSTQDHWHETALGDEKHLFEFFGRPTEDMQAHVLASISTFAQPLNDRIKLDELSLNLNAYLVTGDSTIESTGSGFAPPISLTPLLSFNPLIRSQARIVNGICMRMFFQSHNLREHLAVQRSFHLLGNGVFSSRLAHALFDPELESAERQKGVARSGGIMGLRLNGRDTWPPASSELRLSLMGILTETYASKLMDGKVHTGTFLDQSTLPGDLSFSVRDMSEQEIKSCMDPDALEALDFLRLSYKAPTPLDAIITPIILFKYDQLFRLLLRVLRMLYVVSALFRDARTGHSWKGQENVVHLFRIEAQHFVSSISDYFFETGIEATWIIFENKLDQVESRFSGEDNCILGSDEGLDRLRDYHERVLDKIMFALLLRKRQQPVMRLLEEIFTVILKFSKISRQHNLGLEEGNIDIKPLYAKFKQKVGVFINVCRGMSEKKGYGEKQVVEMKTSGQASLFDGSDLVEDNTITHLLTRLEMSNYYTRANR